MNFDNIRLDKGLYTTGKSFSDALESIDPSENYIGTELEGLDAFQRQLKRFDIKVKGAGSDVVDKFFATTQSSVLFPEYIARAAQFQVAHRHAKPAAKLRKLPNRRQPLGRNFGQHFAARIG